MQKTALFHRGDLVDLVTAADVPPSKVKGLRNVLFSMGPHKLLIMKQLSDRMYLVAVCRESPDKAQIRVDTNCGPLFVRTKKFEIIDEASLRMCTGLVLINPKLSVSKVYDSYNTLKEMSLKKQEEEREKRRQKHQKNVQQKQTQRTLEERYKKEYEFATINNDRKAMQRIVDIVGYEPGLGSRGPAKAKCSSFAHTNPKPYQGGRFSPK